MIFDTKVVVVLRSGLLQWQTLNITAFLTTGIAAQFPEIIGEDYQDKSGNVYNALSRQPIIVLSAESELMAKIQQRLLQEGIKFSAYIEEMFKTGHDDANREVFSQFTPETAKLVGLAFRADKKLADKISKGAKLHA